MQTLTMTLAVLLFAVSAQAQTNPVPAGQPFPVAYDHDGANVTGFQCRIDGQPAGAVLPASARSCLIPGQPSGSHVVTVTALNTNAFGTASAISAPLTVTAGVPPPAPNGPTNLRIVVQVAVQPSGDVTLLAATVTREP